MHKKWLEGIHSKQIPKTRGVGRIWGDKRRFYYFLLYKTLVFSALSQKPCYFFDDFFLKNGKCI